MKELAGIQVKIRPIGTFLNFDAANKFRERHTGKPTGETFNGFTVYLATSEIPGHPGRVLFRNDATGLKDMTVFLELRPEASEVSEANLGGYVGVTVFTHLDDRFELYYGLPSRQFDEINSIDQKIKDQIHSFLVN